MKACQQLAVPLKLWTLSVLLIMAPAVDAGIFPGHLDPNSDGFVPAYNADLLFDIPNSCLAGTGYTDTSGGPCSSFVIAATVNLYGDTFNATPTGTPLDTINWPGSAPIVGVAHSGGVLTGVDTDPFFIGFGSSFYSSDEFFLQLISGQCDLESGCPSVEPFPVFDPGYLYRVDFETNLAVPNTQFPARVTFGPECTDVNSQTATTTNCRVAAAVPEPPTVGLLGAALALLFFWRNPRRRRIEREVQAATRMGRLLSA